MSSHMPPVPPANRSKKGPKSNPETSRDKKLVKHEHHANAAEEGIPPISSRIPRTRVTSAAGVWVDRETDWQGNEKGRPASARFSLIRHALAAIVKARQNPANLYHHRAECDFGMVRSANSS